MIASCDQEAILRPPLATMMSSFLHPIPPFPNVQAGAIADAAACFERGILALTADSYGVSSVLRSPEEIIPLPPFLQFLGIGPADPPRRGASAGAGNERLDLKPLNGRHQAWSRPFMTFHRFDTTSGSRDQVFLDVWCLAGGVLLRSSPIYSVLALW